MMTHQEAGPKGGSAEKIAKKFLIPAMFGGLFGYGSARLFFGFYGKDFLLDWTGVQLIALVIACIFMLVVPILLAMSMSRKFFESQRPEVEFDPSEFEQNKVQMRLSAIGFVAYAAALLAMAVPGAGDSAKIMRFGIVAAAMAVQMYVNWAIWVRSDELYRAVIRESYSVATVLIEVVLFLWAAAAILGLGVAFDPLAVVIMLVLCSTVPTVFLTIKRGLTK